ncbi:MAG: beta-ketoacyl-ACP synthase III [Bryobacteraceae bacterium]
MPGAIITALGCYTPPDVLTNYDLEKMVDTNNQWILERTGISERHIAGAGVATSDMAVEAARAALAQRGISGSEIDAVIVCTVTPDMMFPSTACLVQDRIGAKGAWGFDLIAACSGFVYGLTTGAHLIRCGTHKKVLIIGADTMSRIIDYSDRGTCVLFGDGAGAMLLEPGEEGQGFLGFLNEIDGSGGDALKMPAGGSRLPASEETVRQRQHFVKQEGQQVFKYAVRKMYEICTEILQRNGLTAKDVKLMIPHQANRRIITATAERLGLNCDQVVINIDRYANTTAATIPLATRDAIEAGKLKKGDIVLFVAVGAGFTAGANLWRWAY